MIGVLIRSNESFERALRKFTAVAKLTPRQRQLRGAVAQAKVYSVIALRSTHNH